MDFVIDDTAQHLAPHVLSKSKILTIESFNFWIDEALVAHLEEPALRRKEESMPRQPLECPSVFRVGNTVHQFVSVINTESILPVLDYESTGCESSGSHAMATEVFMANTAGDASKPVPPIESKATRTQEHGEFLCTPIMGDTLAARAFEAQHQAFLNERARLAGQQRVVEELDHDLAE